MSLKKIYIGQLLLDNKLITQEQLDEAIVQQKITGARLGQILIDLKLVTEEKLLELLSQQLKIPYIDLKNYSFDTKVVNLLPEFYARHFRAVVMKKENDEYLVGMVDPQDLVATDEIARLLQSRIHTALVREEDLLQIIDMLYRRTTEISGLAEELSVEMGKSEFNIAQLGKGLSATDAPVVKLLESIFEDAVQMNASDIHIEPDENILRIRQRVDGILHEQIIKEKEIAQSLTLRLKLMSGINITEKRVPQDGRFSIKVKDKNYDVRLATLPTQFGESVVMRLLNQSAEMLDLSHMGMPPAILTRLRNIMAAPNGLLLLTGPTGSGKTTTLYAMLAELNDAETKIITVEDPVEYRLPRISQVQILPSVDLTFARALRAILRQDPDIIMIGELRDQETAEIALRSAMTGHFVLSTLHTNDALSTVIRLLDMGVESYLIAAVLRGIIAQRLVRRICKNCIRDKELSLTDKMWVTAVAGEATAALPFKHGIGCNYCHYTGFRGQVGVYELLEWDGALAESLRENNYKKMSEAAKKQPTYRPLILSGLDLAIQGVTTVTEIVRLSAESVDDEIRGNKAAAPDIKLD